MPKLSAGLLLYRWRDDAVEVLLVHPGGPTGPSATTTRLGRRTASTPSSRGELRYAASREPSRHPPPLSSDTAGEGPGSSPAPPGSVIRLTHSPA
jgi:hypothetical protein